MNNNIDLGIVSITEKMTKKKIVSLSICINTPKQLGFLGKA